MVVLVIAVDRIRIDDPIGAIAGHGGGGVVGVLAVGFLTTEEAAEGIGGKPGLFYGGGLDQLGWQVVGLLAIGAFAFASAYILFYVIDKTVGLRSSEAEEVGGLDSPSTACTAIRSGSWTSSAPRRKMSAPAPTTTSSRGRIEDEED
jgi:Amt family ammonium transporter